MLNFLNDIPLLLEVSRQKSFTKAADILGIGASTLSRRIRQAEERMGVPLFYRDTRNVELTEHGARLVERCEFIVEEARKAQDALLDRLLAAHGSAAAVPMEEAVGQLRISLPPLPAIERG